MVKVWAILGKLASKGVNFVACWFHVINGLSFTPQKPERVRLGLLAADRLALELGDHGGDQAVIRGVGHVERVGSSGGNLFGGSNYEGDNGVTAGDALSNQVSAGDASFGEILASLVDELNGLGGGVVDFVFGDHLGR